jgi:citrate synthase
MQMANKAATLNIGDQSIEMPVLSGSVGPDVIDIRKLYAQTSCFTFDPGFTSTASCESQLTYIDGDEGILLHRGYSIEELSEESSFMEVSYLLLNGELPSKQELDDFSYTISRHTMVHEQLSTFYRGFRRDAHPMAIMCGVVGALSAFYHDSTDIADPEQRRIASHRLIAKMPTIAAMAYKYSVGQPFVYPDNKLSYTGNFLKHDLWRSGRGICRSPRQSKRRWTASSSCMRITSRTRRPRRCAWSVRRALNPFACIAAGIACLWGPAHGGANEAALNMLREIGTPDNDAALYRKRAKDKNDPFRLMGFGHRVYKNYDPRATVMQKTCREVLDALEAHRSAARKWRCNSRKWRCNDPISSRKKLLPERRFLFGHHPVGDRLPDQRCSPCCSPSPAPSAGSRSGTK